MISIIMGKKGTGKTKYLVDHVNTAVKDEQGTLVFISKDNRLMYDLKSSVRYIITEEFSIDNYDMFYGFVSGIIANNFDTSNIFIDSIWKIVAEGEEEFDKFIAAIEKLESKWNINFTIAISAEKELAPEYIKKYLVEL
ncbi:MAG: hypothetical protein J6C16_00815 [Clostridia bacterium]|nr:hypothetical protein [Clostridia bacterium]